jgi:hypothetical protein
MKAKQIKHLLGLAVLLIIAVVIDLTYYKASEISTVTFDVTLMRDYFESRGLILVLFYSAFFIVGYPLLTINYSSHFQTWAVLIAGLAILIILTYPRGGQFEFTRNLHKQIISIMSSQLGITFHYGAVLTALGFYRLGRSLKGSED